MLRFRDFTKLAVGHKIFDSEIQECPKCGRNGLIETVGGQKTYLHSETIGFADNGNPVMAWDECRPA